MARNTPLSNVVAMLKAELAANMTVGVAAANDTQYACLIAAKQRWLADIYDWPFLENAWDVENGGGVRYLPLPINQLDDLGTQIAINMERPCQVKVFFSNYWQDLLYGISEEEYNYINSDQGLTLDPIQRWRFSDEFNFEVWPVPQTATTIRFRGQRALDPLLAFQSGGGSPASVSPQWDATLDLDDVMVMLYTAAEQLELLGKGNAQSVLARATNRMQQIRASYPKREMTCAFGQNHFRQYNKIIPVKKILVA